MGSLWVGRDWATSLSLSHNGEGNGNPLQCSCLENPRDGRAWWAAVYGVAQSWTRLKRLSSSSGIKDSGLGQKTSRWRELQFYKEVLRGQKLRMETEIGPLVHDPAFWMGPKCGWGWESRLWEFRGTDSSFSASGDCEDRLWGSRQLWRNQETQVRQLGYLQKTFGFPCLDCTPEKSERQVDNQTWSSTSCWHQQNWHKCINLKTHINCVSEFMQRVLDKVI